MNKMLKQSDCDQEALRNVLAAIGGGDTADLIKALQGKEGLVQGGVPVRGSGTLPLQAAVAKGKPELVSALLEAGAPLGTIDGQGLTPLKVRCEPLA